MSKSKSGYRRVKWLFGKEIEIPEEWEIHTVESVSKKIVSGGTPSTTMLEYWNGNIPWTRSSVLLDPYLKSGEKFITAEGLRNSSSVLIPKNNLLVSSRVSVGNISISAIDVAISQDVTGIIINKAYARSEFLYWYLKQHIKKLVLISQGTTIQGFTRKELAKLLVFLPSLSEQQKIASILSGVDALIESTQEVIAKTERLKKSLMQKLLTKGIGHTEFREVKSMLGKYERIPKGWGIKKLDEIGNIIGGGTPDSTNKKYWNGNILWATPTDITKLQTNQIENTERKITKQGLDNSSAKLLPKGTILITSRATIGECAIATQPIATNQGFQSIICNDRNFDRMCIFYLIRYHKSKLLRLAYGTTFLEINKSEIKKAIISIPSLLSEQQKIASILSRVDAYIQKNQEYKKKAELLKKGLMQKLLTGQIRVKVDH